MSLCPKYPNLELIEYKARLILSEDSIFMQRMKDKKEKQKFVYATYETDVFPQVWSSTCTGFDIDNKGNTAIAGQAMTKEYTTVVHEIVTDMYIVFFGDCPGYIVYDPKEVFYEDLRNRNMASKSEAIQKY